MRKRESESKAMTSEESPNLLGEQISRQFRVALKEYSVRTDLFCRPDVTAYYFGVVKVRHSLVHDIWSCSGLIVRGVETIPGDSIVPWYLPE
jgi:hypothetical protein